MLTLHSDDDVPRTRKYTFLSVLSSWEFPIVLTNNNIGPLNVVEKVTGLKKQREPAATLSSTYVESRIFGALCDHSRNRFAVMASGFPATQLE